MIITVTLNPSVDINYKLDTLKTDTTNRVTNVTKTAGGKGINVTRILRQLNENTTATGFTGGPLGEFIQENITAIGATAAFTQTNGQTRNCIAIIHDGKQTEILEPGPTITDTDLEKFIVTFKKQMNQAKVIAISGSLPAGLPNTFYNTVIETCNEAHIPVILDTSGPALEAAIKDAAPYVIKPNEEELAALIGDKTETTEQIVTALRDDTFAHIPWIFVTRGAKGAIVKVENTIYVANIPTVEVINPVGSGDATVAGIAAGIKQGLNPEETIKQALTMGTLNAMEEKTGHINPANIKTIQEQITVQKIK